MKPSVPARLYQTSEPPYYRGITAPKRAPGASTILFRRALKFALLLLPFPLVFLVIAEIWFRATSNPGFTARSRCFTETNFEAPAFRPLCEERQRSAGGLIDFRTNEDGFRDQNRAHFQNGAWAVLGDSFVEGYSLPEEAGLVRSLEKELHLPLLNLGIRASGPTQQLWRLRHAIEHYRLRGAIWVLNPSDPLDEIYFYARNPAYRVDSASPQTIRPLWDRPFFYDWVTRLSLAVNDQLYSLFFLLEKFGKQSIQANQIAGLPFSSNPHCAALFAGAKEMRARGLPLLFVVIPHGPRMGRQRYLGTQLNEPAFAQMIECANQTKFPLLDMSKQLENQTELYWPGDWHFNAKGANAWARAAAPWMRSQIGSPEH